MLWANYCPRDTQTLHGMISLGWMCMSLSQHRNYTCLYNFIPTNHSQHPSPPFHLTRHKHPHSYALVILWTPATTKEPFWIINPWGSKPSPPNGSILSMICWSAWALRRKSRHSRSGRRPLEREGCGVDTNVPCWTCLFPHWCGWTCRNLVEKPEWHQNGYNHGQKSQSSSWLSHKKYAIAK